MNEGIIREGDSIEEIIESIIEEYNVDRDAIEVETIEESRKGFLGIGKKNAKARIRFNMSEVDKSKIKTERKETKEEVKDISKEVIEILQNILDLAQIEGKVEGSARRDKIFINMNGDGSGILIGRRGKTLDAIQYIMNKIVVKQFGERYSVIVDTEDYRNKRKENLKVMAQKLGNKAKRIGKPISLRSMNAKERRIIHLALKEEKNVMTKSVGKGENKKLIIFPTAEKRHSGKRRHKK